MTAVVRFLLSLTCIASCASLGQASDNKSDPFSAYMHRCKVIFSATSADAYLKLLARQQLTLEHLRSAEQIVESRLFDLPALKTREAFLLAHPESARYLKSLYENFQLSVGAYIRGFDSIVSKYVEAMTATLNELPGPLISSEDVLSYVLKTATDPQVERPYSMAEFILKKQSTIEGAVLLGSRQIEGLNTLQFPGTGYLGALIPGPRQIEAIRLALQYTQIPADGRILEIGYGELAVLAGLQHLLPQRNFVGVDPLVPPEKANEILAPANIELVQGIFPDTAFNAVHAKGPYSAVIALDTIKKNPEIFETKTDPVGVALGLFSVMTENSSLVIMNDYAEEPYFDRIQAEQAGFKVVRWGSLYELPSEMKALLSYPTENENAGRLALFVLHKGNPKPSGIQSRKR